MVLGGLGQLRLRGDDDAEWVRRTAGRCRRDRVADCFLDLSSCGPRGLR